MSGGFSNPIIGGGGALVYPSIHSPNFVTGISGWTINRDGSAELDNVTLRGSLIVKGTPNGIFIYDGAGNLIDSIAFQTNVDPLTHSNLAGTASVGPLISPAEAVQMLNGALNYYTGASASGPWTLRASLDLIQEASSFGLQAATQFFLINQGSSVLVFLAPTGNAATDTALLSTFVGAGQSVVLMPGTFNLNCGDPNLTAMGPGQYIVCSGDKNTIINAHGSGDLFYWSAPSPGGDLTVTGGGLIGGATIDGASCSGAATGIHAGDINALRFDCRCQNFNQTGGSWGFLFDNQNTFTERLQVNIRARSCGFAGGDGGGVGFNVGGALTSTGSFARVKGRIEITTATNQRDGLVLMNGAHIYDSDLEMVGNFSAGASATTAAAIRITGTVPVGHPGAGTASAITNSRFAVGIECGTGANAPTTFIQGTSSNGVRDCYGNVNFNQNFVSSGITGPGWRYDGQVQGSDTSLGTRRAYGTAPTQTITANGQTISTEVPSAKIPLAAAASFTGLILAAGDEEGQVIWLVNTSTHNQTFDVAGTSNVATGASAIVLALEAMQLIWDAGTALWYQVQ